MSADEGALTLFFTGFMEAAEEAARAGAGAFVGAGEWHSTHSITVLMHSFSCVQKDRALLIVFAPSSVLIIFLIDVKSKNREM